MTGFWLPAAIVLTEAVLRLWALGLHVRRLRLPIMVTDGRVALILPLTGQVPGLEALFAALAKQTLRPARLIVAVESAADPAAARATACAALLPCPMEIIVAGQAERCGQKNLNLLAALARIEPGDEAVITLDADIRPQPWWLSALASPILRGEADVTTGYRWPVPGGGVAAALWTAFDRGFGMLPKPVSAGIAWGGSIAMAPAAIARMDLPRRIGATLSDDLVIGQAAVACGLRFINRRAVLPGTPMEGPGGAVLGFARRQFQLMHVYTPRLWAMSFAAAAIAVLGWLGLIGWALAGWHAAWPVLAVGMAAGALRWAAQRHVAEMLDLPADPPSAARVQLLIAAFPPIVACFALALFVSALRTQIIRWRHIDYAVAGPAEVRVMARRAPVSL